MINYRLGNMASVRSVMVLAVGTLLLMPCACGPSVDKHACVGGSSASALVADAAIVRLDVYGADAHCSGDLLVAGAGAPIVSHTYPKGQPIALDVSPGPHALVLTTYADDAATEILGEGCTEANVAAGAQVCFDLTVGSPPDGGDDLAAGGCGAPADDVNHCGGCSPCDQIHSAGASCVGGICVYTACRTGFADCNTGGTNADGCETDITSDPQNCGGCGRVCNDTNVAQLHCTSGTCDSSCNSGFGNCSLPPAGNSAPYAADDGCESNLTTCLGQACCSMSTPTPANMCAPPAVHVNGPAASGLGQTYADCHALGTPGDETTYTMQMTQSARAAAPAGTDSAAVCGTAYCLNRVTNGHCYTWCGSNDTVQGGVGNVAGHVYQNATTNCQYCPAVSNPTWN